MPREKQSNLKRQETTYLNTAWLPKINGMFKSKGIRLSDLKNMLINVTPCTAYSLPYDLNMSTAKVRLVRSTGRSQSAPVYTNMLWEAGTDYILNKRDHHILNSSLMRHRDLYTPQKFEIHGSRM